MSISAAKANTSFRRPLRSSKTFGSRIFRTGCIARRVKLATFFRRGSRRKLWGIENDIGRACDRRDVACIRLSDWSNLPSNQRMMTEMPLVTEHFALYHCPRTGGTWVRAVLDALDIPHHLVGYAHSTPGEVPPRPHWHTVAIVRNPRTWFSSWRRLVKSDPQWSWPVQAFLLNVYSLDDAKFAMRHFSIGCDTILRTEYLREDLQKLFDARGVEKSVPDLLPVNCGGTND